MTKPQPREVIIKEINKDSLKLTYRRSKTGVIECRGFDVKCYGDTASMIETKTKELIKRAWLRMNEPYPHTP